MKLDCITTLAVAAVSMVVVLLIIYATTDSLKRRVSALEQSCVRIDGKVYVPREPALPRDPLRPRVR
ncbi:MAG TPA: hypothetical protein VM537_24165 [Anaerolineae bacterium]|nr:hypothetical protein [Anaerolineae bacterium]